jgi:hypothetical protein
VNPALVIPSNTLLFRSDRPGIVEANDIVYLRTVKIGRDLTTVEVLTGLESTDRLIVNRSDSFAEGTKVHAHSSQTGG